MHNPSGLRTVCLIAPSLLLLMPLSILVFALERISQAFLAAHTSHYYYNVLLSDIEGLTVIREHVNYALTGAIIGISVAAFIISGVSAGGMWELRRVEGTPQHQRIWSWTILLTNFANTVASFAVLGWYSALQTSETWKSAADYKSNKTFTRETWFCQLNKFYAEDEFWTAPACGFAQATRYVLIPLAVSSILSIVAVWVLVRNRGGFPWLRGGRGRYGGFVSHYEMAAQHQQVLVRGGPAKSTMPVERPAPNY